MKYNQLNIYITREFDEPSKKYHCVIFPVNYRIGHMTYKYLTRNNDWKLWEEINNSSLKRDRWDIVYFNSYRWLMQYIKQHCVIIKKDSSCENSVNIRLEVIPRSPIFKETFS